MGNPWIGVDLDGTLAYYDKWRGIEHIGSPVEKMVKRVQKWLNNGNVVKVFTARVCRTGPEAEAARMFIEAWCIKHIGIALPVTNVKDFDMVLLYDDRCCRVEKNTGKLIGEPKEKPRRATTISKRRRAIESAGIT